MGNILFFIIAALAGIAMAIQGSLNTSLAEVVGHLEATFIVHLVAILILLLLLLNLGQDNLEKYYQAPWYSYLGGVLSIIIIYSVIFSIKKLGVANATTMIIASQIITATIIDHFGLWGL
ncbi:MAG: DMT family transporter, partial [Bacillota bacterium]